MASTRLLSTEEGIAAFKDKLAEVRFVTDEDQKEIDEFLKSIGSDNGWINMDQAERYRLEYPYMTRDQGAKILELIMMHGKLSPQPVPPGQRFSDLEPNSGEYYPCKLMVKWALNELPTEEEFLAQLEPQDE